MSDFIRAHANEMWSFIAGLFGGGAGGSLLTLKLTRQNRVTGRGSIADQRGATAGGDITGRDKTSS